MVGVIGFPPTDAARCDHQIVAAERPSRCPECDGSDIIQDDDVLDTWFSSGLWPNFDARMARRYAGTSSLLPDQPVADGFDIIFFWSRG